MLAPLTIGSRYFVPKAAQMQGSGWATVVQLLPNFSPAWTRRQYVIEYADGTRETLTDSD